LNIEEKVKGQKNWG